MDRLTTRCTTALLLAALAAPLACGDDTPSARHPCIPGESRACTGPGGCQGGQVCADDGQRFGECDCTLPKPDASRGEPDASEDSDGGRTPADAASEPDALPDSLPEAHAPVADAATDGMLDGRTSAPPLGPFGCVGGHVLECADGTRDPGSICYVPPRRVDLATPLDNVYLDIASGDLDQDGRSEIFALLRQGTGMTRLHGVSLDDSGTWITPDPLDVCDGCEARVAVGDVNGDTHEDVVVLAVNSTDPFVTTGVEIHVFAGDGTGKLGTPTVSSAQIQSLFNGLFPDFAIIVGDTDGNGTEEIYFSPFGNNGFIFSRDESGDFVLAPPYARFGVDGWPELADLTGDGHPEVIGGTAALGIAFNNGHGGYDFASSYVGVIGPGARAADMDGDGFLDLVVRNFTQARIVYGNGFGGVIGAGILIDTAAPVDALFASDVTSDGCLDLVAIHAGVFSVLAATGGGSFDKFRTYPGLSGEVVAADINGDGVIDLAAADAANHTLDVVLSNP